MIRDSLGLPDVLGQAGRPGGPRRGNATGVLRHRPPSSMGQVEPASGTSAIVGDAEIGEGCRSARTSWSPRVRVGDRVKVQNNVSLFTGVQLEDDVFVGPKVAFTNVINPRSRVAARRVSADAGEAGGLDRGQRDNRLRPHHRPPRLRGRGGGGHARRARLRPGRRQPGAADRLDVRLRRPAPVRARRGTVHGVRRQVRTGRRHRTPTRTVNRAPRPAGAVSPAPQPLAILHIDPERGWGGGQEQLVELTRHLAARGHHQARGVPAGRGAAPGAEAAASRSAISASATTSISSAAWRLRRLLRARAVDIVHFHTARAHAVAPWRPRRGRQPLRRLAPDGLPASLRAARPLPLQPVRRRRDRGLTRHCRRAGGCRRRSAAHPRHPRRHRLQPIRQPGLARAGGPARVGCAAGRRS